MDGLFHGKPYEQMDALGGFTTLIFGLTIQMVPAQSLKNLTPTNRKNVQGKAHFSWVDGILDSMDPLEDLIIPSLKLTGRSP